MRKRSETLFTHQYEFPLHNMSVSLNPYDLIHGIEHGHDVHSKAMASEKLGVLVTVNNVVEKNETFVDKLAAAIDELALQPAAA